MTTYLDCEQGSPEWLQNRIGMVTSSRIADVVAKYKSEKKNGEEMACRRNLKYEMIGEILCDRASDHYVSRWMEEGREKEPFARTEYEILQDCEVEQVGFAFHPTIKMAGCSPDGLVGDVGLVEFKCPKLNTHVRYLKEDKIPDEYLPQLVWQLACDPDREWNDFVSFHPHFPKDERVFRKRLHRTKQVDDLIAAYESETVKFLEEVEKELSGIRERNRQAVGA